MRSCFVFVENCPKMRSAYSFEVQAIALKVAFKTQQHAVYAIFLAQQASFDNNNNNDNNSNITY